MTMVGLQRVNMGAAKSIDPLYKNKTSSPALLLNYALDGSYAYHSIMGPPMGLRGTCDKTKNVSYSYTFFIRPLLSMSMSC